MKALVLVGSETGNCVDLADLLVDRLRRQHKNIDLRNFGQATPQELASAAHIFVICSTTGQGALPKSTQPLWNNLLRKDVPKDLLKGVKLSCFGLGDSMYPKFNWAIRKISARLLQLGAVESGPRGEGDEKDSEGYEATFDKWLDIVVPHEPEETPANALLPSFYSLQVTSESSKTDPERVVTPENGLLKATLTENSRITPATHFQDVRHLTLRTDQPILFEPGDSISLFPENTDESVQALLDCQPHWLPFLDNILVASEAWINSVEGGVVEPLTLRSYLKYHADLNSIPRRSFFALAAQFASSEREAERMREFCHELQDLYDYANRPRRSILETVSEFDSLKIPLEYILDLFPVLRPRKFSIASSPSLGETQSTLELCVAVVAYRTRLRRIRRGVCTHWLSEMAVNTPLLYSLNRQKYALSRRFDSRPVILIGTGTGIAPIRSLLSSHTLDNSAKTLFFGCRFLDRDFLYGKEWEQVPNLEVKLAPSREGGGYVQQQIEMSSSLDIKDASIFVCGSSGQMPSAVKAAFCDVLRSQGHSDEEAQAIISGKERLGLYIEDTW